MIAPSHASRERPKIIKIIAASRVEAEIIESRRGSDKKKEEGKIIHRIRENKFCTYCCFLCIRKRKNMQNVLLDEGMKVITEKLDILNLFKIILFSVV